MRRLALGIVVAVVAMATVAPALAAPQVDDRIEKARAAVLTDDYQKELPGDEGAGSGSGTAGTRRPEFRDDRSRIDTRDMERDADGPMSGVFSFLLWGVVIVGAALLAFWIASELVKYGGDDASLADAPAQDETAVDMAVIERPLGDAEELANRGEYREAIHALLLRTLQELVRSASVRVAPAMTSREILGRVPLLADARDALHALIITVELTHFGGDDATLEDYVRCRAQFQKFATAFRASSARAAGHAVPGAA